MDFKLISQLSFGDRFMFQGRTYQLKRKVLWSTDPQYVAVDELGLNEVRFFGNVTVNRVSK